MMLSLVGWLVLLFLTAIDVVEGFNLHNILKSGRGVSTICLLATIFVAIPALCLPANQRIVVLYFLVFHVPYSIAITIAHTKRQRY